MLGLYHILQELTTQFPNILFENCSGSGGGRFHGMGFFMPQTWCSSDNTDALDRQAITIWCFLSFFPLSAITAHISAVPKSSDRAKCSFCNSVQQLHLLQIWGYELNILGLHHQRKKNCITAYLSEYKKKENFFFMVSFIVFCSLLLMVISDG